MTKDREDLVEAIKRRLAEATTKTVFEGKDGKLQDTTKQVTVASLPEDPSALNGLRKALEQTEELWKQARDQSEPVCCFCHKPKSESCYLIQGYAPDKRPIFICSDCVIYSMQILQRNKVKVGPTF
jgi:hypothetical protein